MGSRKRLDMNGTLKAWWKWHKLRRKEGGLERGWGAAQYRPVSVWVIELWLQTEGENVHCPKSDLMMFSLLLLAPWLWISFAYVKCPGPVTWGTQDFLPCLSRNINLERTSGGWEVVEQSSDFPQHLHPTPQPSPRDSSAATVLGLASAQSPLLSPARHAVPRGMVKGDLAA